MTKVVLSLTLLLVCTAWTAVGYYILDSNPSLAASIYFAVQTITTVGYGEGIIIDSPAKQWHAISMMLVGVTLWSFAIATVIDIFQQRKD